MPLLKDNASTMREFFISPQQRMLENWAGISDGPVYASLSDVLPHIQTDHAKTNEEQLHLFWLHANALSEEWVSSTIQQILAGFASPKIIILANVPAQADAMLALRQGATGYCHAYSDVAVLNEVKAVVIHGGVWLGQALLQHLIGLSLDLVSTTPDSVSTALARLTPREREVAQQAALGKSNKEIARQLDITERTVKAHLSSTFERLKLKDRLQLALMLNEKSPQRGNDLPAKQDLATAAYLKAS